MLNVALALIPTGDDDGQAVFFAQPVAGPAYLVIAALVGMVVLVVGEADRIENQVIMDVILVNVSGEDKFIFVAQDFPCQFHADPVGFLWRDLPRFKGLDQVAAQCVPLSMAWRRVHSNSMSAVSAAQPKEDTNIFPSVLSGLQI